MPERHRRSASVRPSRNRLMPALSSQAATIREPSAAETAPRSHRRQVPGYELLEEVGTGGMGVVYKARQKQLGRLVALKMLRSSNASREDLERFRCEAEAVARLEHPGIVRIHAIGEHDGQPFLSLEFASQGSLDRFLAGKPLAVDAAARLVYRLAEAVHFAHEAGIIHRDLKPGNVLLFGSSLEPKITDFGLAKRLGQTNQTQQGQILGTPAYMAPEQAEGRPNVAPATDIYALGAIFYECITGRPPFVSQSLAETLQQVREQEPPLPRHLNPAVPRDAETICLKCLEKNPARRYASAQELARDLERFLAGQPIAARPVGPLERALKWSRRFPCAAALIAVSLLLVLVLIGAVPLHILRLQERVAAVTADLNSAHERHRRSEAERNLARGRELLTSRELEEVEAALLLFATVEQSIAPEEAAEDDQLAHLRSQASELRVRATRIRDSLRGVDAIRGRIRKFRLIRNQALFLLSPDFFIDQRVQPPTKVLTLLRQALELIPESDSLPNNEREVLQQEHQCVLLLLAEATLRVDPAANRVQRALDLLDEAEKFGSLHAIHLRRSRLFAIQGDSRAAACEANRAREIAPQTALDWCSRGQHYWQMGQLVSALQDFDRALAIQPELFWPRMLRALGLQQIGELERAHIELDLCVRSQPDFAWSYLLRSLVHIRTQSYRAAAADLEQAAALSLDRRAQYTLLVQRGVLALAQGQAAQAIADFQQAVLLEPTRTEALAHLAQAYWQSNHLQRAITTLDHCLAIDSRQASLYRLRSQLRAQQGQLTEALTDIDRAIELALGETRTAYQCDKAYLLYVSRNYASALQILEQALTDQPQNLAAMRLHAEVLLELGRARAALQVFDQFLRVGKADVELYRRRARARTELGDLPGVVEEYTLALAIRRDAGLLCARGWAHLLTGDARPAERDFQAALAMTTGDTEALLGIGSARLEMGRTLEGLADIERALQSGLRTGRLYYLAARGLAQAAEKLPRRANDLRRRAVGLLQRAVELDTSSKSATSWARQLRADPAWQALRSTPEWKRFLESLNPQHG